MLLMCGVACNQENESELALAPVEAAAMPPSVTLGPDPPKSSPPIGDTPCQQEASVPNRDIPTIDISGDENDDLQKAIALSLQEQDQTCLQGISAEDQEVSRALEASLRDSRPHDTVDLLNPVDRKRQQGVPVGLKNIGNSCWFNVVIQPLFHIPVFRDMIIDFRVSTAFENQKTDNHRLLPGLQKLLALMIGSERKYIDPSDCVNLFQGNEMRKNAQQDVCEFVHKLLERLEEEFHQAIMIEEGIEKECSDSQTSKDAGFENPIMRLFYGQSKKEVCDEIEPKEETFGQYPLHVMKYKNIHESILASMAGKMPDMTKLVVEPVQQDTWFKILPPVLIFSLSRYEYSHEKQRAEKVHNKFEFPEVLYMDRYMEINKKIVIEKHAKTAKIRQELNGLNKTLDRYIRFGSGDNKYPLSDILRYTLEFAETRNDSFPENNLADTAVPSPSKMEIDLENNDVEMEEKLDCEGFSCNCTIVNEEQVVDMVDSPSPTKKMRLLPPAPRSIEPTELQILQSCLPRWIEDIEGQVSELKKDIYHLESQLNTIYDDDVLKRIPYKLHAVIVHEGQASGGHYWVYIFDSVNRIWMKFNDIQVTESKWEELLQDSVGGQNNASAYCLMYIDESRYNMLFPNPLQKMENLFVEMSLELQEFVKHDNLLFLEEIQNWELKQTTGPKIIFRPAYKQLENFAAPFEKPDKFPATAPNSPDAPINVKNEGRYFMDIQTMLVSTVLERLQNDHESIMMREDGTAVQYIIEHEKCRLKSFAAEHVNIGEPSLFDFGIYLLRNEANEALLEWYCYEVVWQVTSEHGGNSVMERVHKEVSNALYSEGKWFNDTYDELYSGWLQHYRTLIECTYHLCWGYQSHLQKSYCPAIKHFLSAFSLHRELETSKPSGPKKTLDSSILSFLFQKCIVTVNKILIGSFINGSSETELNAVAERVSDLIVPSLYCLSANINKNDMTVSAQVRERWCVLLEQDLGNSVKSKVIQHILEQILNVSEDIKHYRHETPFNISTVTVLYKEYRDLVSTLTKDSNYSSNL